MQSNRQADTSILNATKTQAGRSSVKSAPIILDLETLKHVSGGSPKGSWVTQMVIDPDSPKGSW